MASEDTKRKVSSIFITLSASHQTKHKQYGGNKKGWVHAGPAPRNSGLQSAKPQDLSRRASCAENRGSVRSGRDTGMRWGNDSGDVAGSTDLFSSAPVPPPSPSSELRSPPPDPLPTPTPPAQKPVSPPPTSPRLPPPHHEVVKRTSSRGMNTNEKPSGIQKDNPGDSRGLCGFCEKPVRFSEQGVTAMKRIYHKTCFRCSTCRTPLGGKKFYPKEEVAQCEGCYEASFERCWSCGYTIRGQLLRALQRPYHPACFTCTTCKQPLQSFIQADTGEVYCSLDYGRKCAKKCSGCHKLIMSSDGSLPPHLESDGRYFHDECYRCEVCHFKFPLSSKKEEGACYDWHGKRVCLACYWKLQGTAR
ncbi:filamin-binding LIM protein 1 [Syngnathoides biaculeatus]|uniref:filamin-binding LIM protein 1 n=1 Tax=Syngnathoides biaculeatus TaxID=300417 RepID=UPI002ADE3A3A|nr:filamin-binding LIM protein 1 [Syngnathoides biaculeatus]